MAATKEFAPTGAYTIQHAAAQHLQLRDALAAGAEALNLAQVSECDTAGVQLLLSALHTAQAQHRQLQISQMSGAVSDALQHYGLSSLIESMSSWRCAA